MQANLSAIPPRLHALAGQIIDADGHEYTPVRHWNEQFGSITRQFADAVGGGNFPLAEPVDVDATEITPETVWRTKLIRAPGAFEDDLDAVIDTLHAAKRADPAQPVLVAGDPEMATRAERLRDGVPVPDDLMTQLRAVASAAGVPFVLSGS